MNTSPNPPRVHQARGRLRPFVSGALIGACLLAVAAPSLAEDTPPPTPDTARRRELRRTPVVEAVERAAPSVVSIGTKHLVKQRFLSWDFLEYERRQILPGALGSGVIVNRSGYVITNLHVINEAYEIYVKLTGLGRDEREIPAQLIATDPDHDLALLRLQEAGPYPAAEFGDSNDIMVGETVLAMGNPFGLGRTVTTGVVSAVDREIQVRDRTFGGLIQTDAAVNQGNSGGALLNILGEWIGVNSAIYSLSGGSDGISFAIPIQTVREFVGREMLPRAVGDVWLGWELRERAAETPAADDPSAVARPAAARPAGVEIDTVYPTGPAAVHHLRKGMTLLEVDGVRVRDLFETRMATIAAVEEGRGVRLLLQDGERRREVDLEFERVPTDNLTWERLGIRCQPITPQDSEERRYVEGTGVVILSVREGGPAARIGLQPGDLLQRLGDRTIGDRDDLLVAAQWVKQGEVLPVALRRARAVNDRRRLVHETLEGRLQAE